MARISLDPPRTLLYRACEWYSIRRYGEVLDPVKAFAHNSKVLCSYLRFEQKVEKWDQLDPTLRHLALMASAARIGCSWCVDFGSWVATELGLPLEKVRLVPSWREHPDAFSELETAVMAYAETMTDTPPTVSDDLAERLLGRLGEAAFVELTTMIALENLRSRVNSAFGLPGQGFANRCAAVAR